MYAVRVAITRCTPEPSAHSDRIVSMRLPLKNKHYATLFSVYAPTLQAEPAEKDKFYSELRSLPQGTPADDKLLVLGDFNARVGQDAVTWKGILGRHGVGNCNDNGRLLLEFCTEQQHIITNTIFQQKDSMKTAWMHPRSKHWHLIDYVLAHQRDLKDILHTKVMPSAECHTDHRLVRCKLKLHFNSKEVLGFTTKRNKDWFDENNEEIQKFLAEKRSAHQAHPSCSVKKAAFRHICSNL